MALKRKTLLLLLLVSISLIGCSLNRVVLHPIEKSDIVAMKKGEAYTPEKDGWFLSDLYLEEVAKARVD